MSQVLKFAEFPWLFPEKCTIPLINWIKNVTNQSRLWPPTFHHTSSPTMHQAFSKSHVEYMGPEFLNVAREKDCISWKPNISLPFIFVNKIFFLSNKLCPWNLPKNWKSSKTMKINERRKCMILFKNLLRLAFEGETKRPKQEEWDHIYYRFHFS